ncbi:MAG: hypothetical protein H6650_17440 [Ardenticatenales bacterium]|nr:hypothetical protein [Ardenticatenales bacterium]
MSYNDAVARVAALLVGQFAKLPGQFGELSYNDAVARVAALLVGQFAEIARTIRRIVPQRRQPCS